jgi:hypothetical protein
VRARACDARGASCLGITRRAVGRTPIRGDILRRRARVTHARAMQREVQR